MSILVEAINQQIDQSISKHQSKDVKFKLASQCNFIKQIAIVIAIAVPIFACFLPSIFGVISSLIVGLIGYDIFSMANNLGNAAKLSIKGGTFGDSQSNVEMFVDSTILAKLLYEKIYRGGLKNCELAKETPQVFRPQREAVFENTARSEDGKPGIKPMPAKPKFSIASGPCGKDTSPQIEHGFDPADLSSNGVFH